MSCKAMLQDELTVIPTVSHNIAMITKSKPPVKRVIQCREQCDKDQATSSNSMQYKNQNHMYQAVTIPINREIE